MKLEHITIAGTSYPMCLSLAALEEIDSALGGIEKAVETMSDGTLAAQMSTAADMVNIMIVNGCAAEKALGNNAPDLPAVHVKYLLGLDDLADAETKIMDCLNISTERKQEASPPKNTNPMPEDTPTP